MTVDRSQRAAERSAAYVASLHVHALLNTGVCNALAWNFMAQGVWRRLDAARRRREVRRLQRIAVLPVGWDAEGRLRARS